VIKPYHRVNLKAMLVYANCTCDQKPEAVALIHQKCLLVSSDSRSYIDIEGYAEFNFILNTTSSEHNDRKFMVMIFPDVIRDPQLRVITPAFSNPIYVYDPLSSTNIESSILNLNLSCEKNSSETCVKEQLCQLSPHVFKNKTFNTKSKFIQSM